MLDETREEAILLYFAATKKERGGGEEWLTFPPLSAPAITIFFFASFPFFVGEEREGRRNKRRRGRR